MRRHARIYAATATLISFFAIAGQAAAVTLPDGRVWERVSPALNGGGSVLPGSSLAIPVVANLSQAAGSGDSVAYTSNGHFAGDGGGATVQYLARRTASGWATEGISPFQAPGPGTANFNAYQWLSEDLRFGAVLTRGAVNPGDPPDPPNLFLRDNSTGTYENIFSGDPLDLYDSPPAETLVASQDGEHVVYTIGAGNEGLFEWTGGVSRNVAVLPDGTEIEEGAILGSRSHPMIAGGENPISVDGSRLFFSIRPGYPSAGLYVREDGTNTTLLSGSERAGDDPEAPVEATFELASRDGSTAVFTSIAAPLAEDVLDGLYRWDSAAAPGERLTDITADPPAASPEAGEVLGTVGASDDATSIYFVDTGKLTDDATLGSPNLYLWRQGQGIVLVATLSTSVLTNGKFKDEGIWSDALYGQGGEPENKPAPYKDARVTPDGRFIAFGSVGALTSYATDGTKQIYLYDSETEDLACASCGTVHASSKADSWFLSANTENKLWDGSRHLPRNLSADGSRLFFDSKDALVPGDTNGVTDVYQWHDGKIDLISSGTSGFPSRMFDASSSGDDVFFTTVQQLVPSDRDNSVDLYDARVGGQPEPAVSMPCAGDECQGTPLPPPAFLTPSSLTATGKGNLKPRPRRCPKGKVRRGGRCKPKKAKAAGKRAGQKRRAGK